jgi:hypothetical protein
MLFFHQRASFFQTAQHAFAFSLTQAVSSMRPLAEEIPLPDGFRTGSLLKSACLLNHSE